MVDKYANEDAAVTALRPGWKIVGRAPYVVETDNPAYASAPATQPAKIKSQVGTILSIEGPNGEPDTMTVSVMQAADFTDPNRQSGPTITVLTGPTKGPSAGGTNKPSDPTKWTAVNRDPTDPKSQVVALWDPVNSEWHPLAAEPGDKPTGVMTPAVITETLPDGTTRQRQIGAIDQGDKSFHPLTEPPKQPTGDYEYQYVTNADGSKRMVGMTDKGDKHFIPISADPTTQKRTIQTPTAVYSVDDNDNVKKLFDIEKNSPYQAMVIDGVKYRFDPNEKDPNKAFTQVGPSNPLPKTLVQDGVTYVLQTNEDGSESYKLPPGVQQAGQLQTNTTAKTLDWYDSQGKLIKSVKNTNYIEPKVDAAVPPATNLVAKKIFIPDPEHPGQLKIVDNPSRVTASQALQNLASQLSGQVVDGDISVDEAKALIDSANAQMTAAASAASTELSAINQGAATGAGMLNQRVQAAQGFVQQGMGLLGQTKHGLLVAPEGDFGQNLVQGAAGYATELGGGPEVYAAAANLVRRADPTGAMGQDAAAAYGYLTQMFQKFRQTHGGQPSPEEAAAIQGAGPPGAGTGQQANQQSYTAPPQASPWQRADQMYGTTPPGNAMALPGQAGTVPPGSPQYLGNFKAPAFAQSGLPEGRSVPTAPFVAPPPPPMAPAAQQLINAGAPITPQQRNITITVPT